MIVEGVHNYYEHLVVEYLSEVLGEGEEDEHLGDIACIALNKLPPKYVRHDLDTSFFMTSEESSGLNKMVKAACDSAIERIDH